MAENKIGADQSKYPAAPDRRGPVEGEDIKARDFRERDVMDRDRGRGEDVGRERR